MSPVVEKWLIQVALIVMKNKDKPNSVIRKEVARISAKILPYLNNREKSLIYNGVFAYLLKLRSQETLTPKTPIEEVGTKPSVISVLEKTSNKLDKVLQTKAKVALLGKQLTQNGNNGVIFYLSSHHQTPAKKHKSLQGKVYYDNRWRQLVNNSSYNKYKIEKIIKERNMLSVQAVTKAPYWFIFRPYCRHYFVPVTVEEVMTMSDREILMKHPEARKHVHRSMTDSQRKQKYRERRARIRREYNRV